MVSLQLPSPGGLGVTRRWTLLTEALETETENRERKPEN
jgi:hypothetical protein